MVSDSGSHRCAPSGQQGDFMRLVITALALVSGQALAYQPRTGDIVFHTSTSAQSAAIQAATHSVHSHVGVVVHEKGRPMVLEAVEPVKLTPLQSWLDRGRGKRYVIKRMKPGLTPAAAAQMESDARRFLGKPYDLTFEWSDDRIYCSELVWKLFKASAGVELAPLTTLRTFDLTVPVVKAKLKERYGTDIPLDEPVVPPSALFDSELLETVAQR